MQSSLAWRLLIGALLVGTGLTTTLTAAQAAPPPQRAKSQSAPTIDVRSRAAIVVRTDTGTVLYRKNADQALPIASITKLMTAMVVLDAKQSLDEPIDDHHGRNRPPAPHHLASGIIGTRLPRGETCCAWR